MNRARIRASELRTAFHLAHAVEVQSESGERTISWLAEPCVVHGRIITRRGIETQHARGTIALAMQTIRIRWRAGVSPKQRLLGDGRIFEIVSVIDPDGCKTVLDCDCIEVLA